MTYHCALIKISPLTYSRQSKLFMARIPYNWEYFTLRWRIFSIENHRILLSQIQIFSAAPAVRSGWVILCCEKFNVQGACYCRAHWFSAKLAHIRFTGSYHHGSDFVSDEIVLKQKIQPDLITKMCISPLKTVNF